jgi:hypothetical protein
MTFNPAIPQRTDTISGSQPPILINFEQLNTLFDRDHISYVFATEPSRGYHKKITFNGISGDPGLTAPTTSLYTKASGATTELFFQNNPASIVQLTGLPATLWANGGSAGGPNNYTIDTPWGVRIYCGETASRAGGPHTVTFPVALAGGVYFYIAAPANTNISRIAHCAAQAGGTGLNVIYGGNATDATWIAIGRL